MKPADAQPPPSSPPRTRGLTPAQVEAFREQGYLLVRDLLPPAALAPLTAELEQAVDVVLREAVEEGRLASSETFPNAPFDRRLALAARASGAPPWFSQKLHGKRHKTAGMFTLRTWPALLDAVESMIGPEIFAHPQTILRPKLPEFSAAVVPWHQDLAYLRADEARETLIVNCWIPLVDARADNGCMQVVRGSHRAGLIAHEAQNDPWVGIAEAALPEGDIVTCELDRGDVLMTTERLVHRSLPYVRDSVRWSLDTRYCRTGLPTGRDYKPGFIARSQLDPASAARSHLDWIRAFEEAGLDWTEESWRGLPPDLQTRAMPTENQEPDAL